ncbi:tyrosine-type recombinase/integrase [Parvularcula flava]|uniref:Tyrosine-type recombinase/integrase n=1 Tax=Aquisalinus luteolus TaxID=1566827 RepID=A0ABX0HM69_9PROT|nr:tyrosine-type recombinase/integrase [Aquisalinus luteolus]NHK29145.1 tyrosine-type recombinase/integrase [Aquisalinus luteolus]
MNYLDQGGSPRYLAPINEKIGRMICRDVDQDVLDDLARELYPACTASTVNRQLYTPVSAVLQHVSHNGWCAAPRFRRPKGHNKRKEAYRWLSPQEVEECLQATQDGHARAMLNFYVGTGPREADGLMIDWQNVYLEHGEAIFEIDKQDIIRRFVLQPRVVASLSTLEHREGRLLLNRYGKPYNVREGGGGVLRTLWHRMADRAGIERFTSHDLRHTWATWHYAMFRDPMRLKHDGHWSSLDMVERYCHQAPEALRDELLKFGWTMQKSVTGGEKTGKMRGISV